MEAQEHDAHPEEPPSGALVAEWAGAVVGAAAELDAGVGALRARRSGHLRLSASYTVAEYLLPSWLQAFHRRHPETVAALEVVNSTTVVERVSAGRDDLGFVESPGPPGGLAEREVGGDELVVGVTSDHPWASRRRALPPAALAEVTFVLRERGSGTRETFEQATQRLGLDLPRASLELGSTTAVKAAVERGRDPGVLSRLAVQAEVADGRLVVVPVDGLDLTRRLRAVWRAGISLEGPASALLAGLAPLDPR
ncbi:MAG: LysR substrate-binding domain-containing protein [Acidimicrobiia bacterium]